MINSSSNPGRLVYGLRIGAGAFIQGLDLEGSLLVGIDPYGLDVRGPFDVVRVPFPDEIHDPGMAEGRVLTMLAE